MPYIFFITLFLFCCTSLNGDQKQCLIPKKQTDTPVWITVFVHGTVRAEWVFTSLWKVLTDSIEGSTYEKAVSTVRNDPHFFQLHAMQEPGLKKIEMKEEPTASGAPAIAHIYDQVTALAQPTPTINYYYTFGWSGLMSEKQRVNESQHLYTELVQEIKKISSDHHVTPRIRLIAYSHGGNVCLHLAQAKATAHESCFCVDELVLLGSPVQPQTDYLVADPMFKKVYNFYSPDDMVQPLDIFSAKKSHRTFKKRVYFSPPDKLKQISVKVAHYQSRQQKHKSLQLPVPFHYKKDEIRKKFINPGHIELWYLGWAASMYRSTFPLHPFPVVEFVSFITTHLDQEPTLGKDINVTIYPQQEIMRLKDKQHHKRTVAFLPMTKIEQLKTLAQAYKPKEEFYQEHKERLAQALHFAKNSKNGGLIRVQKEDGSYYKISKDAMCLH
jgi:hypothetical protein